VVQIVLLRRTCPGSKVHLRVMYTEQLIAIELWDTATAGVRKIAG
jgi:hypothetical protein